MARPTACLLALLLFALLALAGCDGHKTCRDLKQVCDRCVDEVTKAECMDYVEHGTKATCKIAAETYLQTCPAEGGS